jgi:hypothetical protein
MEYRCFFNSEVNIVFPPGTGGNILSQIINDYLGIDASERFPSQNNEWAITPNDQVGPIHLHEFFKLTDHKTMDYRLSRYKEVLDYLDDKLTIIIHADEYANYVDCLALAKKWHRDGGDNTLLYINNQILQGYPINTPHYKQNKHYKIFSSMIRGEVVDIDYSTLFVKREQSEWDLIARSVGIPTIFPKQLENYHQENIKLLLDIVD